jgi:WD40-like Beta Propeller Repeat
VAALSVDPNLPVLPTFQTAVTQSKIEFSIKVSPNLAGSSRTVSAGPIDCTGEPTGALTVKFGLENMKQSGPNLNLSSGSLDWLLLGNTYVEVENAVGYSGTCSLNTSKLLASGLGAYIPIGTTPLYIAVTPFAELQASITLKAATHVQLNRIMASVQVAGGKQVSSGTYFRTFPPLSNPDFSIEVEATVSATVGVNVEFGVGVSAAVFTAGIFVRIGPKVTATAIARASTSTGLSLCFDVKATLVVRAGLRVGGLGGLLNEEHVFSDNDFGEKIIIPEKCIPKPRVAQVLSWDGNDVTVRNLAPGSPTTKLTNSPGLDLFAAWSPDAATIAFTSDRTGHREIFLMNADGSNQRQLTYSVAGHYASESSWSPDGTTIAFSDSTSGIWLTQPDGTNLRRITNEGYAPAWAADGSRIAFSTGSNGAHNFLVNPDGSGKSQLTSSLVLMFLPTWSSDSQRLSFVFGTGNSQSFVVLNRDGANLRTVQSPYLGQSCSLWKSGGCGDDY